MRHSSSIYAHTRPGNFFPLKCDAAMRSHPREGDSGGAPLASKLKATVAQRKVGTNSPVLVTSPPPRV